MRKTLQFLAMARLVGLNPQCAFSQRERLASDTACGSAIRRLTPRSLAPASTDGRIDRFAVPWQPAKSLYSAGGRVKQGSRCWLETE